MNQADFGDWPERFVYVCSAGGAAIVNRAPMMQAGENRVAAVVVLRAISDPDNPTSADKAHAIQPTERLRDYAIRALGLDKSRFRVVQGHPDNFSDWKNVLNEAYVQASKLNCDIVFNVSGGRTPCKIAPLLGFNEQPAPPTLKILSVGLAPFRMDIVEFEDENRIIQGSLPIEKTTSIRDYLSSYGMREIDREGRPKLQDRMINISEFSERFLSVYSSLGQGSDRRAMKSAMGNLQYTAAEAVRDHRNPFPKIVPIDKKHMRFLDRQGLLSGLDGLDRSEEDSLVVSDKFSAEVLAGKWLEAVVYSRLDKELGGRNDLEYGCGIRLALDAKDNKRKNPKSPKYGNEITDLDCVVLADERFDIIEAKAVTGLTNFREGIVRLSEYSSMLSGQAGRAWLVAPFIDSTEAKTRDMNSHASQMGVELLVGPNAVGMLISRIREI